MFLHERSSAPRPLPPSLPAAESGPRPRPHTLYHWHAHKACTAAVGQECSKATVRRSPGRPEAAHLEPREPDPQDDGKAAQHARQVAHGRVAQVVVQQRPRAAPKANDLRCSGMVAAGRRSACAWIGQAAPLGLCAWDSRRPADASHTTHPEDGHQGRARRGEVCLQPCLKRRPRVVGAERCARLQVSSRGLGGALRRDRGPVVVPAG